MRQGFFARGIHCCLKIFAHTTLLCYVQACVIIIATKGCCKWIFYRSRELYELLTTDFSVSAKWASALLGTERSAVPSRVQTRTGLEEFHRGNHLTIAMEAAKICHWLFVFSTGYTQKNGAVSKVNNKFISRLTRAQHTPSAAATVQVSHALIKILQCVHPGSQDTHPHGNQIHPRLGVA
jgi:hypothetical protein